MDKKTEPAKIIDIDIKIEDHGYLALNCSFSYGGIHQGMSGYAIDADFIKQFMEACDKTILADCKNQVVLVTHTHDKITKIAPMPFNEGKEFDIEAWSDKFRD